MNPDNMRYFEHPKEKLSHYSKRTIDIEYRFQFGGTEFAELEGIANRTDFDLSTHSKHSGVDLSYFDADKGERWFPYVIEPAAGLTRAVLAFMLEAYDEDEAPNTKGGVDKRTVMRFDKRLAPIKAAVLPAGRDRHALLRDGGLRHPAGRRGDGTGPGHHGPGAGVHRPGRPVPRRPAARLLTVTVTNGSFRS